MLPCRLRATTAELVSRQATTFWVWVSAIHGPITAGSPRRPGWLGTGRSSCRDRRSRPRPPAGFPARPFGRAGRRPAAGAATQPGDPGSPAGPGMCAHIRSMPRRAGLTAARDPMRATSRRSMVPRLCPSELGASQSRSVASLGSGRAAILHYFPRSIRWYSESHKINRLTNFTTRKLVRFTSAISGATFTAEGSI
jgi:hypothetical protein